MAGSAAHCPEYEKEHDDEHYDADGCQPGHAQECHHGAEGCDGHADAAGPSLQDDTVMARYGVDKQSTGGNHHRNLADA